MRKTIERAFCTAVIALLATGMGNAAEFTMTIGTGAASNGNICDGYIDVWAEKIKQESGGRIDYELYCDGTLAKFGDGVARVAAGIADVTWDHPAAYGARFAGINTIGVPNLYSDSVVAAGALWNAYESGALGKDENIKIIAFQPPENNALWTSKPMADPAVPEGMKFGMGSQMRAIVLDNMGVVPVSLRVFEYYQGLSKGAVDGLMTTAGAIFDFKIEELITDVYLGSFGGGTSFVVMSQEFYDGLPDDLKKVIDQNSGYQASRDAAAYLKKSERELVAGTSIAVHELSDEQMANWVPALQAAREYFISQSEENKSYLETLEAAIAAEEAKM